jgi:hypothetical protein
MKPNRKRVHIDGEVLTAKTQRTPRFWILFSELGALGAMVVNFFLHPIVGMEFLQLAGEMGSTRALACGS